MGGRLVVGSEVVVGCGLVVGSEVVLGAGLVVEESEKNIP